MPPRSMPLRQLDYLMYQYASRNYSPDRNSTSTSMAMNGFGGLTHVAISDYVASAFVRFGAPPAPRASPPSPVAKPVLEKPTGKRPRPKSPEKNRDETKSEDRPQ